MLDESVHEIEALAAPFVTLWLALKHLNDRGTLRESSMSVVIQNTLLHHDPQGILFVFVNRHTLWDGKNVCPGAFPAEKRRNCHKNFISAVHEYLKVLHALKMAVPLHLR